MLSWVQSRPSIRRVTAANLPSGARPIAVRRVRPLEFAGAFLGGPSSFSGGAMIQYIVYQPRPPRAVRPRPLCAPRRSGIAARRQKSSPHPCEPDSDYHMKLQRRRYLTYRALSHSSGGVPKSYGTALLTCSARVPHVLIACFPISPTPRPRWILCLTSDRARDGSCASRRITPRRACAAPRRIAPGIGPCAAAARDGPVTYSSWLLSMKWSLHSS